MVIVTSDEIKHASESVLHISVNDIHEPTKAFMCIPLVKFTPKSRQLLYFYFTYSMFLFKLFLFHVVPFYLYGIL